MDETKALKTTVDELKKAFEEKIRRQTLVITQKHRPPQNDDPDVKKDFKKS
jgi:hypothetical protein